MNFWLPIIALASLIVPWAAGLYLARALRMPDYGWRIALVLTTFTVGAVITVMGWPPNLGPDLEGGLYLVYEVDSDQRQDDESTLSREDMQKLVSAIMLRVNPDGLKEVTVRVSGDEQVEVIVPRADVAEQQRLVDKISRLGTLEFRTLANRRDHEALIRQAESRSGLRDVRDADGEVIARWVPMVPEAAANFMGQQMFATREGPSGEPEILVVEDLYNVTGEYLSMARSGMDQYGKPAVDFQLNDAGARLFGRLTGENLPDPVSGFERHLAILLDSRLHSAPTLKSQISDRGQISGSFTTTQVDDLVSVLNAGALPNALRKEPISSQLIGPTVGIDTQQKGKFAMVSSLLAVMLFMVVYYRFSGIVACIVLVMNLTLVLALMITFNAALSLPGIAGLVLGVGMAVDANVLIYERIREELSRGASLRMAIRNGFDRATTTIVDSNLTTLITGVVLYWIGTDQIRGFAITLILGLLMNLFTAVFCARVIFEVFERQHWIKNLSMLRLLTHTSFDFVKASRYAMATSLVVILIGVGAIIVRGNNLLDIDFTGGVSVQANFRDTITVEEIRTAIDGASEQLPDAVVTTVEVAGDEAGHQYILNTSQQDKDVVEATLFELFGDKLDTNRVQLAMIEPVVAPATPPAAETPAAEPAAGPDTTEQSAPEAAAPTESPATGEPATGEPATGEPAAEEPAAPAETTEPAAPAEPAADDQAATRGRGASLAEAQGLLAMAGSDLPGGVLLAQAETPPAATPETAPEEAPATGETPAPAAGTTTESTDEVVAARLESLDARFAGGTKAVLDFEKPVNFEAVVNWVEQSLGTEVEFQVTNTAPDFSPTSTVAANQWIVYLSEPPAETAAGLEQLQTYISGLPYFPSSTTIGGRVAGSMREQAILAMLVSQLFIILYIWIRFQRVAFGVAAVIAVIHAVAVVLGIVALSYWLAGPLWFLLIDPFKISLTLVAAFLTLIGYSLNDTIVIFDRIREVRGKSPTLTPEMINTSINQTLSRTIITGITTILVLLILYVAGGSGIHGFTFVMLIGVIVGTYSSIFIAAPLLLYMMGGNKTTATKLPTQSSGKPPRTSQETSVG